MNVTGRLVTALARTLPGSLRDRYREEWLADLNGARELRLSAWSVVGARRSPR